MKKDYQNAPSSKHLDKLYVYTCGVKFYGDTIEEARESADRFERVHNAFNEGKR